MINWVPLFTFAVLFGLSMDYHVFVLNQIREAVAQRAFDAGGDSRGNPALGRNGNERGAVMVSVFAIFASLHMIEMKELGVSLAVAVLVDALVVRVIVLPSLMMLLGRWNWWPGRIKVTEPEPAPGELVAV